MRILVAFASAHGSTKGVAEAVGAGLHRAGHEVDVRTVDEIGDIDAYDAVIIGSAVHDMAWLPSAAAFVERRTPELVARPVWLFSVCSVGDSSSFFGPRVARVMRRLRSEPKTIAAVRAAIAPRGHRSFSGAVERTHWDLAGHLFLVAFGGSYGDHRDWLDIDRWATAIASELSTAAGAAPR